MGDYARHLEIAAQPLPKWYGIYTRSRHEQKVYNQLVSKYFSVFYPKIETWSRRRDRRKRVQRPLFPGYLFVHTVMNTSERLEILSCRGLVRILGHGNGNSQPVPIPEEQIVSIQRILEAKVSISYHPYLKEGERVRIIAGPLLGIQGVIIRASSAKKARLVISIDQVNQALSVDIDADLAERL